MGSHCCSEPVGEALVVGNLAMYWQAVLKILMLIPQMEMSAY